MTTEVLAESAAQPYHKILGPFKRETDREHPHFNKILPGQWTKEEFKYLANLDWLWTEKVDGTNIRVHWDGVKVTFQGRTNNAQVPPRLLEILEKTFIEELFEEYHGAQPITFYGEGYGGKIQKGGNYRPDEAFIMIDAKVGRWWLRREDVLDIAQNFDVPVVPQIGMPRNVHEAIADVRGGIKSVLAARINNNFEAEGLVGTPMVPLFNRAGERAIMKIKAVDFK